MYKKNTYQLELESLRVFCALNIYIERSNRNIFRERVQKMCKKESRSVRARGHSASECEAGEPRSHNRSRGSRAMSPNGPPGRPERYLGPPRSGPAGAGRLSHIYKSVVFIAQHRRVIRPAEWAEGAAGTAAPRGPPSAPAADLLGVCGGARRQGRRPSLRPRGSALLLSELYAGTPACQCGRSTCICA